MKQICSVNTDYWFSIFRTLISLNSQVSGSCSQAVRWKFIRLTLFTVPQLGLAQIPLIDNPVTKHKLFDNNNNSASLLNSVLYVTWRAYVKRGRRRTPRHRSPSERCLAYQDQTLRPVAVLDWQQDLLTTCHLSVICRRPTTTTTTTVCWSSFDELA